MGNKNLKDVSFNPARKTTPSNVKAKKGQIKSDQGAYVFKTEELDRARRFLILGSDSNFYATGSKFTRENAKVIRDLARSNQAELLVDLIVDVSEKGSAPKQSPGLFALALVIAETKDDATRTYAYQAINRVARTASTLFEFMSYLDQFDKVGGTGYKKAIGRWYTSRDADGLAYQIAKYPSREGFDHSRALRLSKYVKSTERPELSPVLDYALGKPVAIEELPRVLRGRELAKKAVGDREVAALVREYGLSWEMVPTEALNSTKVWDALLDGNVPLGALIRQLSRLTRLGVLAPMGGRTQEIVGRLTDEGALRKARIHPVNALVAQRTYLQGYSSKGKSTWRPVSQIGDALEETFYRSFGFVEPTNKRHYIGLDVSASMDSPNISDDIPLTPREASAVMAMVVARSEPNHYLAAFQTSMVPVTFGARDSLARVVEQTRAFPFAGTNLSLPFLDAARQNMPVDAFVLYTDNQHGLGNVHPFQALEKYRRQTGIQAKLVVNAMTATRFSMADPSDANSLDVAGFDKDVPALIAEFVR